MSRRAFKLHADPADGHMPAGIQEQKAAMANQCNWTGITKFAFELSINSTKDLPVGFVFQNHVYACFLSRNDPVGKHFHIEVGEMLVSRQIT